MKLLRERPSLRNANDLKLCKYYAIHVDKVMKIDDIKTSFDTITRCRRRLVERFPDRYAPTSIRIINARKSKERSVRRWSQK